MDVLRQVWELDEPIVIRVRHELPEHQARLLLAMGCGYVVDATAPRCAIRCGHKECWRRNDVTEAPQLIGRNRISPRGTPLGSAVPVSTRPPDWRQGGHQEATAPLKTADEIRAAQEERRDAQEIVTLCGFCEWRYEGTAGDCREAARAHREQEHPEANVRRARRSKRMTPRSRRGPEEEAQMEVEVTEARRVRAEREDADRLAKVERGRQRDALAAMDAGEPQEELGQPVSETPGDAGSPSSDEPEEDREVAGTATNGYTHWTKEEVVDAIQRWARENGRPPRQRDWAQRGEHHPGASTVAKVCGGWGAALIAAGFENPVRNGGRGGTRSGREPSPRPVGPPDGRRSATAGEPSSRPVLNAGALEQEAFQLRQRAEALEDIAAGIRRLEELDAA